jgi:thiol:disulfide interchange protein/DsbC/DsbD-like thiol-disulfide interchange protein
MIIRMNHALPALAASLLLAWAMPSAAQAPSRFATDQVTVSLVASQGQVRPGEPITLGLHQQIIPHWHTYWQNAGDSGVATTIEWQLPPGAKAGEILWPIPKHFHVGPVTNFGYENAVTLLTEVNVPADAKPGEPFTVTANASWLVCAEVCIPQKAKLQLTLPVAAPGGPAVAGDTTGAALIDAARKQLPHDSADAAQGAHAVLRGQQLALTWPASARTPGASLKEARFYPLEWGRVAHNAAQPSSQTSAKRGDADQADGLLLTVGESPASAGQALPGVVVLTEVIDGKEVRKGFHVKPTVEPGNGGPLSSAPALASTATSASTVAVAGEEITLLAAIALAFVGGLILNLMPCVFPVLSIKALSLLKHSGQGAWQARSQGLSYAAGVLGSFALLAGLLLILKATGSQVGWGFQFQSSVFVLAVAYLMFAVGLSLSGVFTIGASLSGMGSSLADKPGLAGSFFTGVLATVVATPCTAPFMGGAIGFALGQPAAVVFAVFLSLGLGLASPYLLLSFWPALQHRLPRPGAWMERFKQFLAFPMYAAAAWLVWVLAQQAGVNAAGAALLGMVAIGFAAWVYDSTRQGSARARHAGVALASLSIVAALAGSHANLGTAPGDTATAAAGKHWQAYTPARLSELRAQGQPVFVNLTAAWCITCLANERVALSQTSVVDTFKTRGITYLKGDWTNQDPEISKLLGQFGRSGVPLYLYYPPGAQSEPLVLPQLLTPDIVLSALKDAPAKVALNPALTSTSNQP